MAWWLSLRRSDVHMEELTEEQATIERERAAFDREREAERTESEQAAKRRIDYEHRVRVLERRARLQARDHHETG